jgi:acetyl esterase/lipase
MIKLIPIKFYVSIIFVFLVLMNSSAFSQQNKTQPSVKNINKPIKIWPTDVPGENTSFGEEKDTSKPGEGLVSGKPVIRTGNVSVPTITIYKPESKRDIGATMIVCPGGGYSILAYDLEGTEICEWLNSIGFTAVLLKYRVPRREGLPPYHAPLQDLQRTIGLIRENAKLWNINSDKIGVMGFSAGAHLSAVASTNYTERTYPLVDQADQQSAKPDFTMLVYPAYLTLPDKLDQVAPELKVSSNTSPTLIIQTQDDPIPIEGSLFYYLALKKAGVPVEMHLYPKGGHGYGLRIQDGNIATWTKRAEEWLTDIVSKK